MIRLDDSPQLGAADIRREVPASLHARALSRLIRPQVIVGALAVTLPDGEGFVVRGRDPGPVARLEIASWRALMRTVVGGTSGAAGSYIAGDWDSPDLPTLIEFCARNLDRGAVASVVGAASRPLRRALHVLRPNSRNGSKRNVAAHYDIGNDFYAAWLDRSMTYSGAYFTRADMNLEEAQTAKYRRLLRSLGPVPGQHILEIGCGWGGLAEVAARDFGLEVTAITISEAQFDYARERIDRAGLAGRVHLRLQDYRDVAGRFDHVVSIEMLEAVGEAFWPRYFRALDGLLVPGGRAAVQVITIDDALFDDYRRRAEFIQTHVFPGGMLPSVGALSRVVHDAGFAITGDFTFGCHYAQTLTEWRRRFESGWPRIAGCGFDEHFRRLWRFYLSYCEGGFRAGRIDLHQYRFERAAEVSAGRAS